MEKKRFVYQEIIPRPFFIDSQNVNFDNTYLNFNKNVSFSFPNNIFFLQYE